ncbi:HEAT repeat domain-containing protein [Kitasatospora sp. NBC_00240]|uniref:HEAT repeat domain-containing protein n=1 Tax=Kitasatospora sp. NBC_00240 TaxID=2903567 RepID=UPI00224C7EA4|nr:HEAT repeat domain-containing protein [Kitasatospora sp. NBC_00240]MCX5209545.1 HEAT repeat domain-containing protein [Kitasatospora sp. NBC_00240]
MKIGFGRKRPGGHVLLRLQDSIRRARARGNRSFEELTGALRAAGKAGQAGAALELLAEHPALLLRLDADLRREHRTRPDEHPPVAAADGVALALLTSHHDGRVREQAVRRILADPSPELLPFLVLRAGDWVPQVRDQARAGLALLLHRRPDLAGPPAVRTALLTARRDRGSFALAQLRTLLAAGAPAAVAERLLDAPQPEVRRFALDAVAHRLKARDLLRFAELDADHGLRARAAEAVAREALWTEQHEILRRLAGSTHQGLRVTGLTGLVRAGLAQEAAGHLDDPSPLVRALAREAVRRAGGDAPAHYRAAVAAGSPSPAAVDGLAEVGGPADADALTALLGHPAAQVRARAVRALRLLGAVPVPELTRLLRDNSATVVREAATALLPSAASLPTGLLGELLTDPERPAVRRAAYRLLARRDTVTALRAALLAAGDPHPRLARQGRTDTVGLARWLGAAGGRDDGRSAAGGDAVPAAELLALAGRVRPRLPEEALAALRGWAAGAAASA